MLLGDCVILRNPKREQQLPLTQRSYSVEITALGDIIIFLKLVIRKAHVLAVAVVIVEAHIFKFHVVLDQGHDYVVGVHQLTMRVVVRVCEACVVCMLAGARRAWSVCCV